MREKGQTEVAKTLETPVFSRGIEILTEKIEFQKRDWIMCVIAVCVTAFYFVLERTVA